MAQLSCPRCGKVQEARTGKKYCDECRVIVRREQKREAAKTFRKTHPELIREQSRIRNQDPWVKFYTLQSHRRNYPKHKNDPAYVERNRLSAAISRDRDFFGGNTEEVYARDGGKCVVCGSEKRLDIHHKDGNGTNVACENRNNSLDNLVLLCRSCHMKIHYSMIKKR